MSTDDPTGVAPASVDQRYKLLVDSVQDYAIFMLDPAGRVQTWNAGAQRMKGYAGPEIIGRSFHAFYLPEDVARGWPEDELARAQRDERVEDEGWRLRKDGSRFWASVVITALRGPGGELIGYAKVTRDLTERRQADEALLRSEEQLRLLVGSVKDYAIFLLDADGRVQTWNAGAETINGYRAEEVVGRHFSMFFTPEDVAAGVPARELQVARERGHAEAEGWRVRKGGQLFWVNAVLTPVISPDGSLRGYAKVTRDLSEQRRLMELERSSRRMEEFLAMLAHELRNPLAPLRNAMTIMKLRAGLPPYMAPIREMMDRQLAHLTRLVDDLLDVARITTGKIPLQREWLDLRDVVRSAVEAARPRFEERHQVVALALPDEPLPVIGDATRLGQLLHNLLGNASRYTPEGGQVRIEASRGAEAVLLDVTDTGVGIAPEALERIFQLFAQEHTARDPGDSGLGIGLSLARKVAELHGGALTAASEGLGHGSTFTLILPAALGDEQAAHTGAGAGAGAAAPGGPAPRRVLVVDDNTDSTDSMSTVLRLLGNDVRSAYGGAEALAIAQEFAPEVVLLDLNMPNVDGMSVMKQLRQRFGTGMQIAAMTGYARQGDVRSTLEAGFDAHLTKPVGIDDLRRLLAGLRQNDHAQPH